MGRLSREDQRPLRLGQEDAAGTGRSLAAAIRLQRHIALAGKPVWATGQLRPDRFPCHPSLIKKCFDAFDNQEDEIVVWGDGSPTGEFLYVEDCAEPIVLATECYDNPEPVNIRAGLEISIKDLVHLIADLTGFKGHITWDTTKPGGQPRRCMDVTWADRELGF